MAMPINLVLVRHGESEGNVVKEMKTEDIPLEFKERHSSLWRLTDKGVIQAIDAGNWLKGEFPAPFDQHYTSEYTRAMETAGLLNLQNATWRREFYLREREWGDLDSITHEERKTRFAESMRVKKREPLFWIPPNGESMTQACLRIDRVIQTLHRECSDKNVIIVCHGEIMWGFRIRLERMSQDVYNTLDMSKHPHDRMHNCQIVHYTRRDPVTNELSPNLNWRRSVCPWDTSLSSNVWEDVTRPKFSNNELLHTVGKVKRIVY